MSEIMELGNVPKFLVKSDQPFRDLVSVAVMSYAI